MAIGKPVPLLDAVERVTGTVPYGINLALPDMLYARVLRSPVPYGLLRGVDVDQAVGLPCVVAVLTASDFDRPGGPSLISGAFIKDQPVLAKDRLRYIGEPVALIAAETEEVAEQAAELIDVDFEELPAIYAAEEAMTSDAPTLHEAFPDNCFVHAKLRHGDLEAGFASADLILEETYTSPMAQQASLEPHVTAAQWADGKLTVWSASQAPSLVQRVLSELFSIPLENVRVIVPPLGGGYGGKGHVRLEPMVAALAWKVNGKPVKLVLSREEEFVTVTKHAAKIIIKSGAKQDGSLTARQVTIYWNAGGYADVSPALVRGSLVRALGPYRLPAARVDAYGVYTNLPPAGAFRGAMSSQTTWAYESHMDVLARKLDMGPLEFRLRNMLRDEDIFATGEKLHDLHFVDCLQKVAGEIGWDKNEQIPGSQQGPLKRGRGLAVMIKSSPATSRSQCRLVLDDQGHVRLFTSTVEMGQGAHTALSQIAADALEVPMEAVAVVGPDTAVTPFDSTTSASRSTYMMGNAVLAGARELKRLLLDAAVPLFEEPVDRLGIGGGAVYSQVEPAQSMAYHEILRRNGLTQLEAQGELSTQGGLDPETGQGIGSSHYHQGAGACEVEVDVETGKVKILRYSSASFAGRVVNPRLAQLQNDGNVIYGLGPAMMEEMVVSGGQVINPNLSEYQIPSFRDVPEEMISFALESHGSEFHGIGEMTLPPVAPAIANAIFDAVGVRIRDLPLTPEKVLRAILDGNH
ncbi:MAG: xanthine dehydrogenase family protein molybdopterin-binding subunit [Anaerolineales bacterium]|jgi:CO/xanthine dehydrogenase Mo-binding subunit